MEPGSTGSAAGEYNMTFLEDSHNPACRVPWSTNLRRRIGTIPLT